MHPGVPLLSMITCFGLEQIVHGQMHKAETIYWIMDVGLNIDWRGNRVTLSPSVTTTHMQMQAQPEHGGQKGHPRRVRRFVSRATWSSFYERPKKRDLKF